MYAHCACKLIAIGNLFEKPYRATQLTFFPYLEF